MLKKTKKCIQNQTANACFRFSKQAPAGSDERKLFICAGTSFLIAKAFPNEEIVIDAQNEMNEALALRESRISELIRCLIKTGGK